MNSRGGPPRKALQGFARQNRRQLTVPERQLWRALRDRRFVGWKFRRQVPIGPFIADFYCHARRLVVEIDGTSHDDRDAEDRAREDVLRRMGLQVARFSNDDVLRDLEGVLEGILRALNVPS